MKVPTRIFRADGQSRFAAVAGPAGYVHLNTGTRIPGACPRANNTVPAAAACAQRERPARYLYRGLLAQARDAGRNVIFGYLPKAQGAASRSTVRTSCRPGDAEQNYIWNQSSGSAQMFPAERVRSARLRDYVADGTTGRGYPDHDGQARAASIGLRRRGGACPRRRSIWARQPARFRRCSALR